MTSTKRKPARKPVVSAPYPTPVRSRHLAAVRYIDGRRDRYTVLDADDCEDARRMIFDQLLDVLAVVVIPVSSTPLLAGNAARI